MRILFVSDEYSIHTVRWVNSLADRNHEVHLASRVSVRPLVHPIDPRVHRHSLGNGHRFASVQAGFVLKKLIRKIRPDIINAHFASSYGLSARIAKGHPLLLNVWGSDVYVFPNRSWLHSRILRQNLLAADQIASTSPAMAQQVRRLLQLPDLPIDVIPFGVDISRYRDIPSQTNEEGELVIGLIKTLKPTYGISCLIDAMPVLLSRLAQVKPDLADKIKLHIYGEGELRPLLADQIGRLNLSRVVELKGYVKNESVPEILAGMAVYCLPSLQESFGVSAVEAMAAGLPVIATDTEGFRDIVVSGETGQIVPVGDAAALADALFTCCMDPQLRRHYGEAGRRRAIACYDWNRNVDQMEAVYRRMIEKNRTRKV